MPLHAWAAEQAGAELAVLDGVPHWWPQQDPRPAVEAITRFWARVEQPVAAG